MRLRAMCVCAHTERSLKQWFSGRKMATAYYCAFVDGAELHTPLSEYRRAHKL